MNVLLKQYSQRHENYVSFVVTASQHCYLPHALMYTADTSGTQGSNTTPLVDWLRPPCLSAPQTYAAYTHFLKL